MKHEVEPPPTITCKPADGFGPSAAELRRILEETRSFLLRFVSLPSDEAADFFALWVVHTHIFEAFEHTPYLIVTSPEKRCGKSRLLEVAELLSANPWSQAASPSPAALYRRIDQEPRPTVLIDEVDGIFRGRGEDNEALRGVLNAGFRVGGTVARCDGDAHVPRDFNVFCPKLLAGIDARRWPDTVRDRGVVVELQRTPRDPGRERLRWRLIAPEALAIKGRIINWAEEALEEFDGHWPDDVPEISDRAADIWEPLLAIAEQAGGDWVTRARKAAVHLSGPEEENAGSLGIELLAEIRSVFDRIAVDRLPTAELCDELSRNPEARWASWNHGTGIQAHTVAKALKPFGIGSGTHRFGDKTLRGYKRAEFEEAWAAYLPPGAEKKCNTATDRAQVGDPSSQTPAVTGPDDHENQCCTVADVAPVAGAWTGESLVDAVLADRDLNATECSPVTGPCIAWDFGGALSSEGQW